VAGNQVVLSTSSNLSHPASQIPIVGSSILCIGARFGEEVFALRSLGFLAVGIDLYPSEGNRYVTQGDIHHLDFPDRCFDAVFTNVLDHILYLDAAMSEVSRVIKRPGRLLTHLQNQSAGTFEVREWVDSKEFAQQLGKMLGVQPDIKESENFIEAAYFLSN